MNRYFIFFLSLFFFFACTNKPKKNEFKVEGFLTNGAYKTLKINELTPEGTLFIDSIVIDKNGEFEYIYKMPYKSFYTLETDKGEFVTLLPNYQEIIVIEGDYDSLSPTYKVEGSLESKLLWNLNKKELEGIYTLNSLIKRIDEAPDSANSKIFKAELDTIYFNEWFNQKTYYSDYIYDNKGSLVALMALYKKFNKVELFLVSEHPELYDFVLESLSTNLSENPHTKHFAKSYQRKKFKNQP